LIGFFEARPSGRNTKRPGRQKQGILNPFEILVEYGKPYALGRNTYKNE